MENLDGLQTFAINFRYSNFLKTFFVKLNVSYIYSLFGEIIILKSHINLAIKMNYLVYQNQFLGY